VPQNAHFKEEELLLLLPIRTDTLVYKIHNKKVIPSLAKCRWHAPYRTDRWGQKRLLRCHMISLAW